MNIVQRYGSLQWTQQQAGRILRNLRLVESYFGVEEGADVEISRPTACTTTSTESLT